MTKAKYFTHYRVLTSHPDCDVNAMSGDYCTALYYAVLGNHMEIVKQLVNKGGNQTINETDWDGLTPLHNAALLGLM